MFTEGLDQSAINWVKQGSKVEEEVRSPLANNYSYGPAPRSPVLRNASDYMASHALPPLKFHSGLLGKHSVSTLGLHDDHSDSDESDSDDQESVASVPDDLDGYYSEKYDQVSGVNDIDAVESCSLYGYDEDLGLQAHTNMNATLRRKEKNGSLINRGSSKMNLKVEVPENVRGFSTPNGGGQPCRTPVTGSPFYTPLSVQGTPIHHSRFYDARDLGTPSAPPVNDSEKEDGPEPEGARGMAYDGREVEQSVQEVNMCGEENYYNESEKITAEVRAKSREKNALHETQNVGKTVEEEKLTTYWPANSMEPFPCYNTSAQNAWQTLVTYDACIRLCLNAWAKSCPDAPEFLRDECRVLRNAFGLNKLLLQPHGIQPVEGEPAHKGVEQVCSSKPKPLVGRIRVEVKKLRIIPRRKLKSTYSQRGAFYMQAGAEYIRHVSSLVKTGINSFVSSSLSVTCEEPLSCLILLKSSTKDAQMGSGSAICLHPGSGEHHDFYPESQGDALLIEVQDMKQIVQGQAVIPISSLVDNSHDKIRWWPIYHDEQECIGKIQLYIGSTFANEEDNHIKSGPVVETLAYDFLLEAAMRAEHFHSRNLRLNGPWKWLLTEFADYYGVSDCYTKLRYLSCVMNVATPTRDCSELVLELLIPVIKARIERQLNRREKSILLECEMQVEGLLATVFENYKSLDEQSPSGLIESLTPIPETALPALSPAMQVYTLLHDILAPDAQTVLKNYLQTAAQKRCRKHMLETDEFMSASLENVLVDPISISTAYLKMKNLCMNISSEIHADVQIHNQHILPSSMDLSNITAVVYSTELNKRLKGFLASCPPSGPLPHVNELLVATSDFERDLESWNISTIPGGVNCNNLFHNYIMVWVQEMQIGLLDLCRAEKMPWSGVTTNHSSSPFAENMYSNIKDALTQYEVVISRWPDYTSVLENAVADIERAIVKALEKQYNDILTPLRDSIPKKLGMHVQKLARRQSTTLYTVPNQLGIFLNTVKRILDILHGRVEDILKSWASCLPIAGEKKSSFGEQMNGITVLLRTKYKNYMQAIVTKLYSNMQASRSTQLKRILEETRDSDGETEIRERMQMLSCQLIDTISNLHEVFTSQIFTALCRGFWDKMGQTVLKFLEGRKENRVWYKGSYYALGILDDMFASQMQRLQGNSLQEKDVEPPRSVVEARSILCRDTTNGTDQSSYFYF